MGIRYSTAHSVALLQRGAKTEFMALSVPPDHGAFTEKFTLPPPNSSSDQRPLTGLSVAVKDIFDMKGHVSSFGNPDWARTHAAATETAPVVSALLEAGATCIGRTVMDEMAYSINGENAHYGTPVNPCAADRVPGGSSSGSAVAVGAMLADFSLGTDTGGSVRVPASYCGILGFRPSHGIISTSGLIPMAQSFDTVGWFARDSVILSRVGKILLQLKDEDDSLNKRLDQLIIAEDCFKLLDIPSHLLTDAVVNSVQKLYGSQKVRHINLGDFIETNVPSLKHFMSQSVQKQEGGIPLSLVALSNCMRLLQRYEFNKNHGEWVRSVNPSLGPGLKERIWEAVETTYEDRDLDICRSVIRELRAALSDLVGEFGILAMPTVPGHPPKLQTDPRELEDFRAKAFGLLSIAGVSGFCQASIPLGKYENLPIAVSLVAKHASDGFLLGFVDTLYKALQDKEI